MVENQRRTPATKKLAGKSDVKAQSTQRHNRNQARCRSTSSLPTDCKIGSSRRGRRLRQARRLCSPKWKIDWKTAVHENQRNLLCRSILKFDSLPAGPSTDGKNRAILVRFGRKKAVCAKQNDISFGVFAIFLGLFSCKSLQGSH